MKKITLDNPSLTTMIIGLHESLFVIIEEWQNRSKRGLECWHLKETAKRELRKRFDSFSPGWGRTSRKSFTPSFIGLFHVILMGLMLRAYKQISILHLADAHFRHIPNSTGKKIAYTEMRYLSYKIKVPFIKT